MAIQNPAAEPPISLEERERLYLLTMIAGGDPVALKKKLLECERVKRSMLTDGGPNKGRQIRATQQGFASPQDEAAHKWDEFHHRLQSGRATLAEFGAAIRMLSDAQPKGATPIEGIETATLVEQIAVLREPRRDEFREALDAISGQLVTRDGQPLRDEIGRLRMELADLRADLRRLASPSVLRGLALTRDDADERTEAGGNHRGTDADAARSSIVNPNV